MNYKIKNSIIFSVKVWATTILIAPFLCIITTNDKADFLFLFLICGCLYSLPALILYVLANYFVIKNKKTNISQFRIVSSILGLVSLFFTSIVIFGQEFWRGSLPLFFIYYALIGILSVFFYNISNAQNKDNQ